MPENDKLDDMFYASLPPDGPAHSPDHNKKILPPIESASQETINADDIDSGRALQQVTNQYLYRIRQLKEGLSSSQQESDHVVDEYLMQNLELLRLNKSLEYKVKERTRELEVAKVKLEVMNNNLRQANTVLEDQAHKLEALGEAKEALMHMIVHDMKNPLTSVLCTLSLFTRKTFDLKPDIHNLLISAHSHGIKLLSMIEEILMSSRMKTKEFKLKPEAADLITMLTDCVALMQNMSQRKKLKLNFNPGRQTLTVRMDIQLIERVVNNLLNNAIKYAPAGGEILMEIDLKPDFVWVSITNWGTPIPKEHHHKIFELFTRVKTDDTQFSGTGIGLAFSKLAVEAHKGSIKVISPVLPKPVGTCFRFSLPYKDPADPSEKTPEE